MKTKNNKNNTNIDDINCNNSINITHRDLIRLVANETQFILRDTGKVINGLVDIIEKELIKGNSIKLGNFLTISTKTRYTNPPKNIDAFKKSPKSYKRLVFQPTVPFKAKLNNKKAYLNRYQNISTLNKKHQQ